MAAAQEIVELFCELIAARLPIIEAQKYVLPSILCALEMFRDIMAMDCSWKLIVYFI